MQERKEKLRREIGKRLKYTTKSDFEKDQLIHEFTFSIRKRFYTDRHSVSSTGYSELHHKDLMIDSVIEYITKIHDAQEGVHVTPPEQGKVLYEKNYGGVSATHTPRGLSLEQYISNELESFAEVVAIVDVSKKSSFGQGRVCFMLRNLKSGITSRVEYDSECEYLKTINTDTYTKVYHDLLMECLYDRKDTVLKFNDALRRITPSAMNNLVIHSYEAYIKL